MFKTVILAKCKDVIKHKKCSMQCFLSDCTVSIRIMVPWSTDRWNERITANLVLPILFDRGHFPHSETYMFGQCFQFMIGDVRHVVAESLQIYES
jgi:hypothetical protein